MTSSFTVSTIVTTVDALVTGITGWIGDYLTVIEEEPILLVGACLFLVGIGVSFISRLIRL